MIASHYHLVGIGGAGMGALAEILLRQGHRVSGSDSSVNATVKRLMSLGAAVQIGHAGRELMGADVLVYSTAISPDNPELILAKQEGIERISRGQCLANLMQLKRGVAITGTHGKTTTTSLMVSCLLLADADPSFAIGGVLHRTQCNGRWGGGELMVVEADESDASFLLLSPEVAIVTNIDHDHMHTYDHDFARLTQCFFEFLQKIPQHGLAVLCWEDEGVRKVSQSLTVPFRTYGFSSQADVWASDLRFDGMRCHFLVHGLRGQGPTPFTVALPGAHNVLNALAVLVVADHFQLPMPKCQQALSQFCGVGRRSQYHGVLSLPKGRAHLLEDYGHHPAEIMVTVKALKAAWPNARLVLVYQPHRYSRTQALWSAFCEALAMADVLLLCDIYAAGEQPIPAFGSQVLIEQIEAQCHMPVHHVPALSMIPDMLKEVARSGDVILLQGAGDIHGVVKTLPVEEAALV